MIKYVNIKSNALNFNANINITAFKFRNVPFHFVRTLDVFKLIVMTFIISTNISRLFLVSGHMII